MKGEWCYFKSYFSKEYCEEFLKKSLEINPQEGRMGVEGDVSNSSTRRSKVRFINYNNPNFTDMFDKLWKMAIRANSDFFNIHITKLDYIQVAEYDASYQGEYKEHQDVFWLNNDPIYHRKITCLIQLSDPNSYEGGDFEILDIVDSPNKEHIREQGTVIFLPSFLYHKAHPVTKGTRYSVAAWFEGPKWR